MKLVMLYCERFAYTPAHKSLEGVPDASTPVELERALVGLIHAEELDMADPARTEKRLIKNLKWGARKNDTGTIVLHSFSHLAASKAAPDFTGALLERAATRLAEAGYAPHLTPFGYFLDLDLQAPGRSTARIFAEF